MVRDSRSAGRVVAVAVLALWAIGLNLPQIFQFWHTFGTLPLLIAPNSTVQNVTAGSVAARAGLHSGDHVDFRRVSLEDRLACANGPLASPHSRCTLPVVEDGHLKLVTVNAVPAPFTQRDAIVAALGFIGTVFFILTGASLVLLRPSVITWSFFACSLWYNPGDPLYFFALISPLLSVISSFTFSALIGFATWGVLYFGLMFPSCAGGTVRLALARYAWVPAVFAAAMGIVQFSQFFTGISLVPFGLSFALFQFSTQGVVLLAIVAITISFAVARGLDRQRLQWVFVAFAFLAVPAVYLLLQVFSVYVPDELGNALILPSFLLPLAVAYTVLVHRVFDINFIISRAFVYAVLTAILVAAFAVIDWFFSSVLAQAKLAMVAELVSAVGLGFWLNGLHAAVDRFIHTTLFRARHRAEQQLARTAAAAAHVRSIGALDEMLVSDPADALKLASAALFRAESGGGFRRHAAINWPPGTTEELGLDDRLVAELRGTQSPLRVGDVRWAHADLPHGAARPALAIPITVRYELQAIALYGAHVSGEDIDPDEVKSIEKVCVMAAAALDHLEALELRRQVEALNLELAAYRAAPSQA